MQDQKKAEKESGLQLAHAHAPQSPLTHLSVLQQQQPAWLRVDQNFSSLSRVTRESMNEYLQFRHDQSVLILYAKVAQKSYGNEKRFFCPPPCVYLCGTGWNLRQEHLKGHGESSCRLCGYMGLDSSPGPQTDSFKLSFEEQTDKRMFACAKTLYISDTDKRKHFRLMLHLFQSGGQEIGSFQSGLIKVISKPSQKRQSMKNADLEEQQADHGDYSVCDSYICYGCVVQLVCTNSGVALPPMVIRKVNKQHVCLDVDEPVSQLHKCAFQFRDSKHMYLCLSNEKILQYQASPCPKESSRELLNDGSCWTIIGTEVVEYTFSESLSCNPTTVSPVPVIQGLELNGGGHVAMLELHGENFSPHLKVWFGNMEADTMFRSPRSLLCVVPDISVFSGEWRSLRQPVTVPLSLIRMDGLIYRSSFTFTYTPEHSATSQLCTTIDRVPNSDMLIDTIHQEFTRSNFHLFMQS